MTHLPFAIRQSSIVRIQNMNTIRIKGTPETSNQKPVTRNQKCSIATSAARKCRDLYLHQLINTTLATAELGSVKPKLEAVVANTR